MPEDAALRKLLDPWETDRARVLKEARRSNCYWGRGFLRVDQLLAYLRTWTPSHRGPWRPKGCRSSAGKSGAASQKKMELHLKEKITIVILQDDGLD